MSQSRPNWEYTEYSEDRLSLAQEIKGVLETYGHWTPYDWAGPDLITAIGLLVKEYDELLHKYNQLQKECKCPGV